MSVQLVSKIANLCGPNSPTLRTDGWTDGQTDDMRWQDRAMHYSASRGNETSNGLIIKTHPVFIR